MKKTKKKIKKIIKKVNRKLKKKVVRKKVVKKRKPSSSRLRRPKKKVIKKKVVKKRKPKIKRKVVKKRVIKKRVVKKRKKPAKKRKPVVFQDLVPRTKIRVIGVGGGGGSIVSEIVSRIKKADFVVANTDAKALSVIKHVRRFQFGQNLTKGLGTGMNTEIGEMAAQDEKDKIEKLFEGQDICIIVSSLGGGAGSGATPIFAKISKSAGCITYGIFTMPFEFEGEKKMEIAKEALLKIKPHLNAFSVIPNERIFQIIDKDTPLKDALSAINERLAKNLEGLIEMIYSPGLINIDFADLKTILSGKGKVAYLNTIEIREPEKPARNASDSDAGGEEAVKKVISSPLYEYTIKGAKGILYNIVGSKALQLSEVSKLSEIISNSANKNAKIIFGIGQNQNNQNKIKITLLAAGCTIKGFLKKPQVKKPKPTRSSDRVPGRRVIQPGKMTGQTKKSKSKRKIRPKSQPKPKPKPEVKIEPKAEPKVAAKPKSKSAPKLVPKPVPKVAPKPKVKPKPVVKPKPKQKQSFSPARTGYAEGVAGGDIKGRRNALQLKKVVEEEEKQLLEQEKVWETPAIFRRKEKQSE